MDDGFNGQIVKVATETKRCVFFSMQLWLWSAFNLNLINRFISRKDVKMRGISFEIKNEYGRYILDILTNLISATWHWSIGPGESYKIENGTLGANLFPDDTILNGLSFLNCISVDEYYVIFADLKAFPQREDVVEIKSYEDFLKSSCEMVLLIIDSSYVSLFVKEESIIDKLFERATASYYTNIQLITDENDTRSCLTVWG